MFEKLDESSRKVVVESQELARSHEHVEVRTDHLLLAVIQRDSTVRARLEQHEVDLDAIATELMQRSPTLQGDASKPHLPFGADYKAALEGAADAVADTGDRPVTPIDLAVAVLQLPVMATTVLSEYGVGYHHFVETE